MYHNVAVLLKKKLQNIETENSEQCSRAYFACARHICFLNDLLFMYALDVTVDKVANWFDIFDKYRNTILEWAIIFNLSSDFEAQCQHFYSDNLEVIAFF